MKKLLLVLGFIMVLTTEPAYAETTQESTNTEAVQLYQTALDKRKRTHDYEMMVDVVTHVVTTNRHVVAQKTINLQMTNQNREGMSYLVTATRVVDGQQSTSTTFYTEGTLYQDKNGQKTAQQTEQTEAMRRSEFSWQRMLPDVQLLEDIYVSNVDENGNIELTYTCEKDAGNQTLVEANQTLNEYYGTIVINPEGYLVKAGIIVDVDTLTDGNTVNTYSDIVIIYNNPGLPVSIELPSVDAYQQ
ncbi:MAG: hypothetical protein ACRDBO_11310 [Lachnospiraceae bacterium]